MASNVFLTVNVSTGEAVKTFNELKDVTKQLQAELNKTEKGSDQFNVLQEKVKLAKQEVSNFNGEIRASTGIFDKLKGVIGESIGGLNESIKGFQSMAGGIKSTTSAIGGAESGFKALKIAIAATGIGLIIVALGALVALLTKTQGGMELVSKVTASVGAAFDVVVGRVAAFAKGMSEILTGNFKQGFADVKGSVTGMGDAMAEAAKKAYSLKDAMIALEKDEISYSVDAAKAHEKVAELREKATEELNPKKKKEYLDQAIAIEKDLTEKEEGFASRRLVNAKSEFDEKAKAAGGADKVLTADKKKYADEQIKIEQDHQARLNEMRGLERAKNAASKSEQEEITKAKKENLDKQIQDIKQAEERKLALGESGSGKIDGTDDQQAINEQQKLAIKKKAIQDEMALYKAGSLDYEKLKTEELKVDADIEKQKVKDRDDANKAKLKGDEEFNKKSYEEEVKNINLIFEKKKEASENDFKNKGDFSVDAVAKQKQLEIQLEIDANKEKLKSAQKFGQDSLDIQKSIVKGEKDSDDEQIKLNEKKNSEKKQAEKIYERAASDAIKGLVDLAIQSSQRETDANIKSLHDSSDARIQALDDAQAKEEGTFKEKTATQKKYDAQRKAIQDKTAADEKKLKTDQAKKDKEAAIIKAVIDGAVAVISQLTAGPFIGQALAVATAAAAAIQVALIAAQPIPEFAQGGIINGPSHAQGGIRTPFGEIEGGEIVLTKGVAQNPALARIASQVNEMGGGRAFAYGGVLQTTPTINSNVNVDLSHINNTLNALISRLSVPIESYITDSAIQKNNIRNRTIERRGQIISSDYLKINPNLNQQQ